MPDDVNPVAFQPVGHGKVEAERIHLQRLFALVQSQCDTVVTLSDDGKVLVAGKAMAWQVILLALHAVGVVLHAAYQREEDGAATRPVLRVALP